MTDRRTHRMGQIFLINKDIAKMEAEHARDKHVLEIGPGPGILTEELCKLAKKVVAVEKDRRLYRELKSTLHSKKLVLINKDFLDATDEEVLLKDTDIVISNVPYSISGKVIGWLSDRNMQAVLCLQKEFVDHMLAKENTRDYSKLSVITSLSFRVTKIYEVSRGNFRPIPKVDSTIIYIKPLSSGMTARESVIIGALMQHKKKRLKNAIEDSRKSLGLDRNDIQKLSSNLENGEERLFKMPPQKILETARKIFEYQKEKDSS